MTLPIEHLVQYARQNSPFYAALYRDIPHSGWHLHELPLIDPAQYWLQSQTLSSWPVLTGPVIEGHVFKTGGSTGDGKLSVYSREEWCDFVHAFGQGVGTRLNPGDRVANLFFAGDLYTSFLFIHGALAHSPVPVCEYPFTGGVETNALAQAIEAHQINVLACVPAQLLRFASQLLERGQVLTSVTLVLYGGESLFEEQLPMLALVLPNARYASVGCASVDAGLIGASTPDCLLGEHRVFDGDALVEIIDEITGEPIQAVGQTGVLVVTNLQRRLMPLIRYPTGDLAIWCEADGTEKRKFALRGRASQGHRVRLGTLSLFPEEIGGIVKAHLGPVPWQLLIDRVDGMDRLTLRIAPDGGVRRVVEEGLYAALLEKYPTISTLSQRNLLRFGIACHTADSLTFHPRSGKLLRVVDERSYVVQAELPA
ncbi:phenylacetate--CoA ligase family protein [Chitinimonas sp. BJB300]|uniref:phenylacetate--CoA ligase family protein n=1 Tax=Chitinimonas sp. BJB300 TaxID=1559339 RepID=UPI000C0EA3FA|nr:AMP-dependent synthetase [Chitinimonas sp. BJB300]PHV13079.1 AMP-dependent synthetase [Chitinimonas sp. BJB300]TSJ87711.1 phenylacetate--CoA ligase [Chitinimonas sp. BJB300]